MITDKLIDAVIDQIKADMLSDDYTAIEELLKSVNEKNLRAFLTEEAV